MDSIACALRLAPRMEALFPFVFCPLVAVTVALVIAAVLHARRRARLTRLLPEAVRDLPARIVDIEWGALPIVHIDAGRVWGTLTLNGGGAVMTFPALQLSVTGPHAASTSARLREFVRAATAQALTQCPLPDVVFTGPVTPGACPVCAASLAGAVTACPDCRTPHHSDCWRWVGHCCVYGCANSR